MILSQVIGGFAASRSARSIASNRSRRSCAQASHHARPRLKSTDQPSALACLMQSCTVAPCDAYLFTPHESHLHKSNCLTSVIKTAPFCKLMFPMFAASPPASARPCSLHPLFVIPLLARFARSLARAVACRSRAFPRFPSRRHFRDASITFVPVLSFGAEYGNATQSNGQPPPPPIHRGNALGYRSFWTHFLASVSVLSCSFPLIPIASLSKPQTPCKAKNKKKKTIDILSMVFHASCTLATRFQRGIGWGADLPFCRSRGAGKKSANG